MEPVAVRPRPKVVTMTARNDPPPQSAQTDTTRLELYQAVAAIIAASAAVLATRLLLLLALVGAFALAVMAMGGGAMQLWVNIAYDALVVIPMIGLEIKTKWGRGG